jgi:amino acid transporter
MRWDRPHTAQKRLLHCSYRSVLGVSATSPLPISLGVIVLLIFVCFSLLQTLAAYPSGGGSYTVASENLGANPGLLAAAALMIDYILVVAVGISAGIGALISAIPSWQRYTLPLCLLSLAIITLVNLRGVRDTGLS